MSGVYRCEEEVSGGDTGINCLTSSPPLSAGLINNGRTSVGYLPAGLRMSVVAEILRYPVVNGGQSHFGLLAGLHGHADEGRIGVGWFDFRVGFVVDLLGWAGLHGHLRITVTGMCATGEARRAVGIAARGYGAPEVPRHPHRGGVSCWGAGRRVAAASRETEPFEIKMLLSGWTARPSSDGSFRVRAEDGEILEPVETSETVVHKGKVRRGLLILRKGCQPFLLKFIGDVRAGQNRHADCGWSANRSANRHSKFCFILETKVKEK